MREKGGKEGREVEDASRHVTLNARQSDDQSSIDGKDGGRDGRLLRQSLQSHADLTH